MKPIPPIFENGSDDLSRSDLGGDIHTDNPGEKLNLFAQPGRFYGYPYCWTEYSLPTRRLCISAVTSSSTPAMALRP